MSQEQSTTQTEDIELDEAGAESVIGGAGKKHMMTIEQAEKLGYKPVTCEAEGMVMENPTNGKKLFAR
jgi:hypothetical protein